MKMSKILTTAIFVSLFLVTPSMVSASTPDDLKVTIKTDKPQYRWLFDKIDITLTVTNTGNESVNITFTTTQFFDFEITNLKGTKIVYIWSYDKVFLPKITNVIITPGSSMNWHFVWNKHQNIHHFPIIFPVSPGFYQIVGGIAATETNNQYATTNITIGSIITPTIPN